MPLRLSPKRLEIDAGQFVTVALKDKCKDHQIEDHLWSNNEKNIHINVCYSTESEKENKRKFLQIVTGIVSFMDHCSHNEEK